MFCDDVAVVVAVAIAVDDVNVAVDDDDEVHDRHLGCFFVCYPKIFQLENEERRERGVSLFCNVDVMVNVVVIVVAVCWA